MGPLKVAVMSAATDTLVLVGLLAVTVGAVKPVLAPALPLPPPHPERFSMEKINKVKPIKKKLTKHIEYPKVGCCVKVSCTLTHNLLLTGTRF